MYIFLYFRSILVVWYQITSKAAQNGLSVGDIMSMADWSNSGPFRKSELKSEMSLLIKSLDGKCRL